MVRVCEHLENQPGFRKRNDIHDTWYRILHGEESVNIGGISERLEHRATFPAVHNDRYRNRLIGAKIVISVIPQKSGDSKSVKRAQAVENMAYFLYRELTRKRTNALFAVDSRTVDRACWAGVGFQRIDWRTDILDKLGDTALDEPIDGNPFVLEGPETTAVFYDESFKTVAQVGEHQVSALLASYEDLQFTKDRGFFTSDAIEMDQAQSLYDLTAKVFILETEEFVYEVVSYEDESEELSTWPNFAGRPRYSIHAGHVTSAREPHRRFRPLIHPLYRLAQERNILKTLLNSGALQTGRPLYQEVPVGSQSDGIGSILQGPGEDQKNITFSLEGGLLPQPREGHQWVPIAVPTSEWLRDALTLNQREEVDHGFPAVLSPSTPLDATSGTDRSEQKEAGTDFLDPPLGERADGWAENFRLMFGMLREAKIDITFNEKMRATGGSDVVPQTVEHTFYEGIDIQVGFSSIPASVEFAEREMMKRDVELGVTALSTYAATLHDDPESEARKAFLDRIGREAEKSAMQDAIAMAQALRGEQATQLANEAGLPLPAAGPPTSDGRNQRPPTSFPGAGAPAAPVDQNSAAPSQNAPVR